MSFWKSTCRLLTLVATVGLITPQPLLHGAPQQAKTVSSQTAPNKIQDVALNSNGVLVGAVIDAQGQPALGVPVELHQGDVPIAETTTGQNGSFAVASLRGGLYDVRAGKQTQTVRVWTAGAAPPQATTGITMVVGDVARGQGCTGASGCTCSSCGGGFGGFASGPLGFLMNPFVIGAAVAAAIAIPLAIDDDDDPTASN